MLGRDCTAMQKQEGFFGPIHLALRMTLRGAIMGNRTRL